MSKKKKVVKGKDLWEQLDGYKDSLAETVEIKFGEVEGEITVVYRDINDIRKIESSFEDKFPEKPEVEFKGLGKIKLPSEDYPQFNDHEKAQEWQEKSEPVRNEKMARMAYEFISNDERPSEDPEEGTEILQDRLRFMDIVKIVNKGMELTGLNRQLDEARKNS